MFKTFRQIFKKTNKDLRNRVLYTLGALVIFCLGNTITVPGMKQITGDLGFLDGDMLFYRGRIDFQVKFNGYRIELEEINFYLAKNPLVRYGVVAPKYNKDHKVRQLVAVVELADGVREKYTDAELTKKLRESLSQDIMPYMLPQRFIYRDEMPISQNGKVDIKQVIKEVNNA